MPQPVKQKIDKNYLRLDPVEVELGGETRRLVVTGDAERIATRLLHGDPRYVLAVNPTPAQISEAAAAALVWDLGDRADVQRVERWWMGDKDPKKKRVELKLAVQEAFRRYYTALGILDEEDEQLGEGAPPPSPTAGG